MTGSVRPPDLPLPLVDGRGGVTWKVPIEGEPFAVMALVDAAYGPASPLFRLPDTGSRVKAARAVAAAFSYWTANRAEIDPMLAAAADGVPAANRYPIPTLFKPPAPPSRPDDAQPESEITRTIAVTGALEATDHEAVRLPLSVDGVPVIGKISMRRRPGVPFPEPYVGCEGNDDAGVVNAVKRFMERYARERPQEIEEGLAESHRLRMEAGISDDEIDPLPPLRVPKPTPAKVRDAFQTSGGKIVFVVSNQGKEHTVEVDSWGGMTSSGNPECDQAAENFVLENMEAMALMGLNVEVWER
jgi:hypothetical protein